MKAENVKVGGKYRSRVNIIAADCTYEVLRKKKTVCWVRRWEGNAPTGTIYKNVKYSVLGEISKV